MARRAAVDLAAVLACQGRCGPPARAVVAAVAMAVTVVVGTVAPVARIATMAIW